MSKWVWADLEMTGLTSGDRILEAAVVITNDQLELMPDYVHRIIHVPDQVLDNMNQWCVDQHGKSGLTEQVRQSKFTIEQVQAEIMLLLKKYTQKGEAPLCGNSIGTDKVFIEREMPQFYEWLNYRVIDVSSIKILYNTWSGAPVYQKRESSHRALDDIKDSIEELKFYRKWMECK